ncbi:MAG: hypothetical protein Q8N18_23815 [Opitutaceae bacterium]|nr:hypothetical protein [Opitutaceae bacterium]
MRFVPRKHLPHDVPAWVPSGTLFFVTLHCAVRGHTQLTCSPVGEALLDAVAHYHSESRWFARLFLLMPDHAHALLAFPRSEDLRGVVSD